MTTVSQLYSRMIKSMGVEGLAIPVAYVKLYRHKEEIPHQVESYYTDEETVMCCQAVRYATLDQPVLD
jgi:hypothetical protein